MRVWPFSLHLLSLVRLSRVLLAGDRAAARDLRQQGGNRLGLGFERGETGRLGFLQLGIVLQRPLVDREQIRRRRGTATNRQPMKTTK